MTIDVQTVSQGDIAFRLRVSRENDLYFEQLSWPVEEVLSEVFLPCPGAGYGGSVLSISPGGAYAAALLYSGQCEQGYELFQLRPQLKHVGGMPYESGTSDLSPMSFSPDESLVAFAMVEGDLWWVDPEDEYPDWGKPSPGGRAEWAVLFVHRLGEEKPSVHYLECELPAGWLPPEDMDTRPQNLRFITNETLSLDVPWAGEWSFAVPRREGTTLVLPVENSR